MYAVIQTGGKQYKVTEGTLLKVEKLEGQAGDKLTLEEVLLIKDGEGNVKIGQPFIEGARVSAQIIDQGKNKKVVVFKYKRRKNYRKKQGHRQPYTRIKIEKIEG